MKQKTRAAAIIPVFNKKSLPRGPVPIENKSALQLLEDAIAVLNNRRELLEKINKKYPRAHDGHKTFAQYNKQTKKFSTALLTELSLYGDAVAGPDSHNAYNDYLKTGLTKWDTMNQYRLILFWKALEIKLKDFYQKLLSLSAILPASLQTIMADQLKELG